MLTSPTHTLPHPHTLLGRVVDRTTRRAADLLRSTFDAFRDRATPRPAAEQHSAAPAVPPEEADEAATGAAVIRLPSAPTSPRTPTSRSGRWIAGQVTPLPDAAEPLETVLGAFDRLFDPTAPLTTRRSDNWTLLPDDFDATGPTHCPEARALEEEGARVLRLRHNGAVVAVAGVHPLSAAPGLRRAS